MSMKRFWKEARLRRALSCHLAAKSAAESVVTLLRLLPLDRQAMVTRPP